MHPQADTSWLDLDYKPKMPKDKSIGIAIIGAGAIVQASHLPVYQKYGLNVIGIYDVDADKAKQVATQFELPHVFVTIDHILQHPDVKVIDIAVPARFQPDIVEQVTAAGKHVLCQKPLAENYTDAVRIVETVEKAQVKGAVNQQMRWSPGIRAAHTIIERGWIGEPLQATIQVNVFTDWAQWDWITKIETLELMYHSIHYLDSIRFLFGTPEYVYCDGAKFPGQVAKGETRSLVHMKFPGEARGLIHDNHNNLSGQDDWFATYRFDGTEGTVKGTNGALYNYPVGREDTFSFYSRKLDGAYWHTPYLDGKWFPDAFAGTMGELLRAIEEDREPENSVRDNLLTLQMLFASYRSMNENRPVMLSEIKA